MADKKDNPEFDALMERYGMKPLKASESKPVPKAEVPVQKSVSPQEEVVPEQVPIQGESLIKAQEQAEQEALNKPPENVLQRNPVLTGAGALGGAMAQYKGVGQNLFKPEASLFTYNRPPPPIPQIGAVPPMGVQPLSDIEHTMQSGQGQRPGETGRMREDTHNMESNRLSLASKQNLQTPGASNIIVESGPQLVRPSGIAIPKSAAFQLEQELLQKQAVEAEQRRQILEKQAIAEQRQQQQQARRDQVKGVAKGTARVGQGFVGGALAAPALYEYGRDVTKNDPKKPADTTQLASGIGGLMMALGKSKMGGLGALAQIPYIVKNRDELARSQMFSDVVADTMRMGMTGSEMFEPAGNMPVKPFPINDGRR